MKSRWASLLLCLAWSPMASADAKAAAPAPQFSVPAIIPSDGVLPVFGTCFDAGKCSVLRSIVVTDQTSGSVIAGHVEIVKADSFDGWGYFVPDQPLQVGARLVVKPSGSYPVAQATVTVTKPIALDADAVALTTTLTKDRTVLASTCCPSTNPSIKPRCLDTSVIHGAVLSASLSAVKPVATQYLFEVRLFAQSDQAGATVFDYAPLRTNTRAPSPRATFEVADSYCYTVSAKPLVGGEPVTLLERCIDNDLTDLGRVDRTANEVASWSATCQVSPTREDGGTPLDPMQTDGGMPRHVDDADDELDTSDQDEGTRPSPAGCQLSGTAGLGCAWWPLLLALVTGVKRRRGA